jgi:probable LLM family oxidoreductase
MEIGIDTFASAKPKASTPDDYADSLDLLLERIKLAEKVGLDLVGVGEHHRKEYLDSAAHVIFGAAAAQTTKIKLVSAVTVLSAADPVRVFQNYATLDLLSRGRAEIVAGRGSFGEAFPLFGHNFNDYEALYEEKLELLLKIRDNNPISWSGKFRSPLNNQGIYPRPFSEKLPIWRGVGGTPASFAKAGAQGLPLMIAIIGGETHRFRPLVDLYKQTYREYRHPLENMKVGIHSMGYIAETTEKAIDHFYPGHKKNMDKIGKERGWAPMTMDRFLYQNSPKGAFLVGDPETVANKIIRHSESLDGLSRFTFQMDVSGLSHENYLNSIELLGTEVAPRVSEAIREKELVAH